ncbi:keratin, type I cytoskeletal 19-like [Pelobates cultripes]|uniref:Keratin, type I cytoskeletal 19-like n=1 Tax=Pelobates cultripes TaxID=61616 RepID=A0AAD1SL15_PELCU|nr:keratin, type I cytoskeletal 19-like [Pelobates cultripes]
MKHIMKHFSSASACPKSDHSSKHSSSFSSSHLGGSSFSQHGGFQMSTGGSLHKSQNGGSNLSYHGGSTMTQHGGSQLSCHGGSHLSNHGSSQMTHNRGSHMSLYGGSRMSHHAGSHKSNYGGSNMSHLGGSHMSKHGSALQGSSHLSAHGGSYHGGSSKTSCGTHSIHGGSGSKGVSFSKNASISHGGSHSSHFSSSGGHGGWKKSGLLSINEKETMQFLNERLSTYLDKVTSLEQENAQLERKICEWYANNAPSSLPDSSQYLRIISDLQNQISSATMDNARILLQIDNARLAADDFKNKFEMERQLSNGTESDANCLRRVLEGLNRERCELEMEVQNLQEELQQMKRNHEEEVNCLRAQLGARVNVELNAAPSIDLNRALSEIRDQYENLMQNNLRETENMFIQRSEELNRQIGSGAEQLQSVQTEVIELKRTLQTLEIELQSQLSMTSALECTLAETQGTYGSQIAQLQSMIDSVESKLAQVRSDLERQNHEYKILMDQKTHLEMEIATYKRLLEGHDIQVSGNHNTGGKHGSHVTMAHSTEHDNKC